MNIIIIGAGMGGLAAGVYGQLNGYQTRIFEMHSKPGGQCASWQRKGYTFDACIHHFFGCKAGTSVYRLWQELGAMPRDLVSLEDCTAVASPDGRRFIDYYDPDRLKDSLLKLSPADAKLVAQYVAWIKAFPFRNVGAVTLGSPLRTMIMHLPSLLSIQRWTKLKMGDYAKRFSDPFLKRAFAQLIYSDPNNPIFFHLLRHAGGISGDVRWPAGGAAGFARSIERRYLDLGGEVQYNSRVAEILVENDKAVGVKLADGSEYRADVVISNADGRRTILELLDGKYINDVVRGYCAPPTDETPFAVDVFLGVNRDLSREPSSLVLLLDQPTMIASHKYENIEMQFYGFDKTMAPPGKSVIKVELPASYAYWKQLHTGREKYHQQKQEVAAQVIGVLENYFPGLKEQVEVVDVSTLLTWERYMGGSQGWFNLPSRKYTISVRDDPSDRKFLSTLPGLSNFYFVGIWASMTPSLFSNANSGKVIIRRLCKKDGKKFVASIP